MRKNWPQSVSSTSLYMGRGRDISQGRSQIHIKLPLICAAEERVRVPCGPVIGRLDQLEGKVGVS